MNAGRSVVVASFMISLVALPAWGEVCNIKVVTDGSPDYSDMESMIHSITAGWPEPAQKCWAMFYWNHVARRQTAPMNLHGMECTDPIRQFNDYGYMMCSTVAGINCSIWDAMGYPVKFWDITLHTVPEVQYGGRWHMYDNSMSALYTLCDGVTIASVEDIGKEGGCEASGGRVEPGQAGQTRDPGHRDQAERPGHRDRAKLAGPDLDAPGIDRGHQRHEDARQPGADGRHDGECRIGHGKSEARPAERGECRRRNIALPDRRQPDDAQEQSGRGSQDEEESLVLAGHDRAIADQERLARPDRQCRRECQCEPAEPEGE